MFLLVSVTLFTWGGGLPQCMLGYHTPPGSMHPPEANTTPSGSMHHPLEACTPLEALHPPGSMHPLGSMHPPPGSRLRHTVNERLVRILLECILVLFIVKLRCTLLVNCHSGKQTKYYHTGHAHCRIHGGRQARPLGVQIH